MCSTEFCSFNFQATVSSTPEWRNGSLENELTFQEHTKLWSSEVPKQIWKIKVITHLFGRGMLWPQCLKEKEHSRISISWWKSLNSLRSFMDQTTWGSTKFCVEKRNISSLVYDPECGSIILWLLQTWLAHHIYCPLLCPICSTWYLLIRVTYGLPKWFHGKEFASQCRRCRRHRFDLGVGKIPWRKKWQPSPVFLPG